MAPDTIYLPEEKILDQKDPRKGYIGETKKKNYILRLRTDTSQEDQVLMANFAKIVGGIDNYVGTSKELADIPPVISFTYYFNPTPNDRNLEFDPERNLFKNLPRDEQVTQP